LSTEKSHKNRHILDIRHKPELKKHVWRNMKSAKEFLLGIQAPTNLILVSFNILKEVVASDMGTLLRLLKTTPSRNTGRRHGGTVRRRRDIPDGRRRNQGFLRQGRYLIGASKWQALGAHAEH
jgi:hypothetical protein